MFHILAVSGSPRDGGNTEILVDAAVAPWEEAGHKVERFYLSEREVAPCRACEACSGSGVCVIRDDGRDLPGKIAGFDAVVVGSPVYNRNVSAQLQALFNRFHCVIHNHPLQDTLCFGGGLAVGGSPNSQGITLNVIYNFLLSLGVCSVPAVLNGVSAVAREKGTVRDQPRALRDARALGENLLRLVVRTKGRE